MAKNELSQEIMQHVVEIPVYIQRARNGGGNLNVLKLVETLKLIQRTQALSYGKEEFEREFGDIKKLKYRLSAYLLADGLRCRIIEDQGKVLVFANEVQGKKKP